MCSSDLHYHKVLDDSDDGLVERCEYWMRRAAQTAIDAVTPKDKSNNSVIKTGKQFMGEEKSK